MKYIIWFGLMLCGHASAQFAYECFPPEGGKLISTDKCPAGMQWRVIQTDPYYTAPVTRVYERQTQGTTVIIRQQASPHPRVVQGTVAQPQPAPVQPGYSNEELSRELNKRYEKYGGYKPGHTLTVGKDGKSYGWHK